MTAVALEADLGVLLERAAGRIAREAHARGDGFAIAAVEPDGTVHGVGDVDRPFAIQSISKVFGPALAIRHDAATVWRRVGREPSGAPFDSLSQLERDRGVSGRSVF